MGELQFIFEETEETMSCVSIGITNDDDVENAEQFFLSLELIAGFSESVEFINGITSVTIEDNDGKSKYSVTS